jgi:hypothetical protein
MKPKIEQTTFGSITIKGEIYEYDVIIRLNGDVKRERKNYLNPYMAHHTLFLPRRPSIYMKKELNRSLSARDNPEW